jgi:acyl-CoA thioester hydrolase
MPESLKQSRPFEIELTFPVKTYDIDFAGILSNIVYIRWLEDLRVAMIANYHPISKILEDDIAPIVLHTSIQYKQAINMFDLPVGRMWMSEMKRLRWKVNAEVVVAGNIAAIAEQSGCFINLSSRKPVPIPIKLSQEYALQSCSVYC